MLDTMRTDTRAPAAVGAAFVMWLVAVGAGVFETILVVASGEAGGGAAVGVTVRVAVFLAAILVALRMRAGRRWARLTLAVGLGVLGTLSLVVDPLLWLLDGNSLSAVLAESGPADLAFGTSRVLHVAAVLTACVLMFLPSSNRYFRRPVAALAT
ncbi:hypothetical protein DFJ67_1877 [Asanoa ferruginea]|uniref:Uncharacterized protein n=2 Tax=Asanoa ferruginea TaxID=53367 RepID=A0A3D9ZJ38_9ACTN|nr:hypothetical protein DFJ67_1877 [Asanoa ferruginea]GIF50711.1 hypothetical protein Afe04nite_52500 [Asanoa ferruginea]